MYVLYTFPISRTSLGVFSKETFAELASYRRLLPAEGTMINATEFVVHQRTGVYAYQRLGRRPDVIRGQIAAVGELGVDQAVNRNGGVRGDLDKAVEGEGEAVVEFVCQILQQTRVVDGHIKRQVTGVDEVCVLADCCNDLVAGLANGRTALCFRTPASLSGLAYCHQ